MENGIRFLQLDIKALVELIAPYFHLYLRRNNTTVVFSVVIIENFKN